jgi:hypothetical protein
LLEEATGGFAEETKKLLNALMVYELPYQKLEELYLKEITNDKNPRFFRLLILQKHHEKFPRLRAKLISLHLESDDSIRSKIRDELPHIRYILHASPVGFPIFHQFLRFQYLFPSIVWLPVYLSTPVPQVW